MNSVRPAPVQTPSGKRWWNHLEEKWNEIQVGRQGSYSVERLESFDLYCRITSRTRVMLVCILSPLPALATTILLECLPLRPPSEGWAANWVFWIRLSATVTILCLAGASELSILVPELNSTFLKRQLVSYGACAAYIGTFLVVASQVGFPIPLMWYVGGFIMRVYFPLMLLIVFGRKQFTSTSPGHHKLMQFLRYFSGLMTLINVYPLYKVLYDLIPVAYRGCAVVVLPIWRLVAKRMMVKAVRELEDFTPEIVAMTVDFFSVLFISVCISTAGSIHLSALFIAADIGQSLFEFREVGKNATVVVKLLRDRHLSSKNFKKTSTQHGFLTDNSKTSDLVALLLAVTRDPNTFNISSLEDVRLRACRPHPLSAEQEENLQLLQASHLYDRSQSPSPLRQTNSQKIPRHRPRFPYRSKRARSSAVAPTTSNIVTAFIPGVEEQREECSSAVQVFNSAQSHRAESGERSKRLVLQGLQLLFHCEYLVLVEYVECVVPLIYVIFRLVLEHLPNVVYHPGGAGNFGSTVVVSILILAALEIMSLLVLNSLLQRKLAFSPLYQLAFVLETQIYHVQLKFFLEVMFVLEYEIEHYGTDFTFQFKWLHKGGNQ